MPKLASARSYRYRIGIDCKKKFQLPSVPGLISNHNILILIVLDLDEVEKLLGLSDVTSPSLAECSTSKFGCCPDGTTPGFCFFHLSISVKWWFFFQLSFAYYTFIGSFVAFFHLVFYLRVYILTRNKNFCSNFSIYDPSHNITWFMWHKNKHFTPFNIFFIFFLSSRSKAWRLLFVV